MEVIYKNQPNVWIKINQSQVVVAVGTSFDLYKKELYGGNYHWIVALVEGEKNPYWGSNQGSASTIQEAKIQAEEFLDFIGEQFGIIKKLEL